jgi:hypothetical protein
MNKNHYKNNIYSSKQRTVINILLYVQYIYNYIVSVSKNYHQILSDEGSLQIYFFLSMSRDQGNSANKLQIFLYMLHKYTFYSDTHGIW